MAALHRRELALWLAAVVALSPVLADLVATMGAVDGSPSVLLPPCLMALHCLRTRAQRAAPRPAGFALIVAGIALELLGLASGTWSLARLALPPVTVGVALLAGRPAPVVAALSLWMIPPPSALLAEVSPALESLVAALASLPFRATGFELAVGGPLIETPSARLGLSAFHSGVPLALLLTQLGWYAAVRSGRSWRPAAVRAASAAVLAAPLQVAGAAISVGLLIAGEPRLAQLWLDYGLAISVGAASLLRVEAAAAAPGRPSPPGPAPRPPSAPPDPHEGPLAEPEAAGSRLAAQPRDSA